MKTLSTIGYEGASPEDFVSTLQFAGIKVLVDVRQVATSRRKGFAKTALKTALEKAGIEYVHLVGLGDPKEGRDAAREGRFNEFLKIYKAHMSTPEFQSDFSDALEILKKGDACMMCYERNHLECHRKLLTDKVSTIVSIDIRHLGVREGIAKNGLKVQSRTRPDTRQGAAACG